MKLPIQRKQRHRARFSCTDRWVSIAALGFMAYLVYTTTAGPGSFFSPVETLGRALAFKIPPIP